MKLRRIRALAGKELLRLVRNRGAATMAAVVLTAGLLVAAASRIPTGARTPPQVRYCWIDYWERGPWVDYLASHVPREFRDSIRFRPQSEIPTDRNGTIQYADSDVAIQLRKEGNGWRAWFWYPGDDSRILAPYESWFWRTTAEWCREQAIRAATPERRAQIEQVPAPPADPDPAHLWRDLQRRYREQLLTLSPNASEIPVVDVERTSLHGVALGQALAVALVLFAVYFVGACLMPSLTCEERERRVLLAQILSPAESLELFAAKAIVFVPLAATLALAEVGLMQPAALGEPLFWMVVPIAALATFGAGTFFAALAPTQRAASFAAMAYALCVALVLFAAQRLGVAGVGAAFVEYHAPGLLLTALNGGIPNWLNFGCAAGLALAWISAAGLVVACSGWRA